jgi:hypothetical protein
MTITLKQLRLKGACWEQADLFKAAFGEKVEVTMDNAVQYADKFDWTWAAEHLLPAPAWKAYLEAKAPAGKAYQEAVATAGKAYQKAMATVWKAYLEARATAFVNAALGTGRIDR